MGNEKHNKEVSRGKNKEIYTRPSYAFAFYLNTKAEIEKPAAKKIELFAAM